MVERTLSTPSQKGACRDKDSFGPVTIIFDQITGFDFISHVTIPSNSSHRDGSLILLHSFDENITLAHFKRFQFRTVFRNFKVARSGTILRRFAESQLW